MVNDIPSASERWITIKGRHILIKKGQSLKELGVEKQVSNQIPNEIIELCENFSEEEIRKSSGWIFSLSGEDEVLKEIIHYQGFDKRPKIVSQNEINNLLENGYLGFTRGMKVSFGADEYKNGEMYIGRGASGSGVYVSVYEKTETQYLTKKKAFSNIERYGKTHEGEIGSFINGVLAKDAKIITVDELNEIKTKILSKLSEKQKMIFSNNGKLAAALGYDAIDVGNRAYFVILNRGKTIVSGDKNG